MSEENAITFYRNQLQAMSNEFKAALPETIKPEKFIRVVLTALQSHPELQRADRHSVLKACTQAAQDGLLPDGREAAIVVYKGIAKYMPMVGGYIKRLHNSRELTSLTIQIVYINDKLRYWIDDEGEHLLHEPILFQDRGAMIGVYALANLKNGGVFIEPMSKAEIDKVRSVSRARESGPWVDWYPEMAKKTALRKLYKKLPSSSEVDELLSQDDEFFETEKESKPEPKVRSINDLNKEPVAEGVIVGDKPAEKSEEPECNQKSKSQLSSPETQPSFTEDGSSEPLPQSLTSSASTSETSSSDAPISDSTPPKAPTKPLTGLVPDPASDAQSSSDTTSTDSPKPTPEFKEKSSQPPSSTTHSSPSKMTRGQIGKSILEALQQAKLSQEYLTDLVKNDFQKEMRELTDLEMEDLLNKVKGKVKVRKNDK